MVKALAARVGYLDPSDYTAEPSIGKKYYAPGSAEYNGLLDKLSLYVFRRRMKHPMSHEEISRREQAYERGWFETIDEKNQAKAKLDYDTGRMTLMQIREILDQRLSARMESRKNLESMAE